MSVAGQYDCVTKSPMGDQKSVLTVTVDGDSWTGSNAGQMGALDITDGKVDRIGKRGDRNTRYRRR